VTVAVRLKDIADALHLSVVTVSKGGNVDHRAAGEPLLLLMLVNSVRAWGVPVTSA
jgi:hypothetical protein